MTIPIKLYDPLYQLKLMAENIWIVDGPAIEMSFGLTKVPFSTRMTVVKLANGKLWCHSPIQPNQALLDSLDQLGEVAYLIGPNKLHYAYPKLGRTSIRRRKSGWLQELTNGPVPRKCLCHKGRN